MNEDLQSHILIISEEEIDETEEPTAYIMQELARYAARLGRHHWKIIHIIYDMHHTSDDLWIEFLCERDF